MTVLRPLLDKNRVYVQWLSTGCDRDKNKHAEAQGVQGNR